MTADPAVRGIASAALKITIRLRELRNDYGTGHGRAVAPVVDDETFISALDGALLWIRWALRRLEHLLAGQLVPLINDLTQTASRGTFVVREAGMEIPLDDPNDAAWPPAYRKGTVEGALLNAAGQVQLDDDHLVVEPVARMVESLPESAAFVRELRPKLTAASWSPTFTPARGARL